MFVQTLRISREQWCEESSEEPVGLPLPEGEVESLPYDCLYPPQRRILLGMSNEMRTSRSLEGLLQEASKNSWVDWSRKDLVR